ncbi:MAG TPA: hypothetical protein VF212_08780 [Longimicrobiales bacterium]
MVPRIVRGRRVAVPGAAAFILTLFAAACNTISDPTEHYAENAHIELTGTSPVPLVLVTSTVWGQKVDEETGDLVTELMQADTAEVELPFERTVALAPTYRILFRVINPDTAESASIRMRVHLDDELVYDQPGTLLNASLEYSFAYH